MGEARKKGESVVRETVRGQDGSDVQVNESRFVLDEQILDPKSPLAVQVPEDAGVASIALADALSEGTVEEKFGTAAAPLPASSEAGGRDTQPSEHVRAVGDDSETTKSSKSKK